MRQLSEDMEAVKEHTGAGEEQSHAPRKLLKPNMDHLFDDINKNIKQLPTCCAWATETKGELGNVLLRLRRRLLLYGGYASPRSVRNLLRDLKPLEARVETVLGHECADSKESLPIDGNDFDIGSDTNTSNDDVSGQKTTCPGLEEVSVSVSGSQSNIQSVPQIKIQDPVNRGQQRESSTLGGDSVHENHDCSGSSEDLGIELISGALLDDRSVLDEKDDINGSEMHPESIWPCHLTWPDSECPPMREDIASLIESFRNGENSGITREPKHGNTLSSDQAILLKPDQVDVQAYNQINAVLAENVAVPEPEDAKAAEVEDVNESNPPVGPVVLTVTEPGDDACSFSNNDDTDLISSPGSGDKEASAPFDAFLNSGRGHCITCRSRRPRQAATCLESYCNKSRG